MAADPMYRQVAEDLRRQIEDGELAPGQQLRTEIELRDRYDASRNTVRDAIKWLITRGLVETRPGQGTFVIKRISPFVTTLSKDPETGGGSDEGPIYREEVEAESRIPDSTEPRVEMQKADETAAATLGLSLDAPIVSRHYQRSIDGTPWSLQTSFYPMSLVERGALRLIQATDITEGTVAYLRNELGIRQTGYRDLITVRAPNETEIAFFKLPGDGRVGVFEILRIAFDEQRAPFRLTVSVYPTDRNQFAVNIGDVPIGVADPASASDEVPDTFGDTTIERGG
jgi:GntR family transcriptional regulator